MLSTGSALIVLVQKLSRLKYVNLKNIYIQTTEKLRARFYLTRMLGLKPRDSISDDRKRADSKGGRGEKEIGSIQVCNNLNIKLLLLIKSKLLM